MSRSRRGFTLLLALILASAAAVGVYAFTSDQENQSAALTVPNTPTPVPTVAVLVAKQDIAAATTLTADMLEVKEVPVELKNTGALTETDQAIGKMSAVALVQGEQILDSRLTDSPIIQTNTFANAVPVGKRAIALVFDEVIGSGALVQPGDHVDVLAFFELEVKNSSAAAGASSDTGDNKGSDDASDTNANDSEDDKDGYDYKQFVTTYIVQDVEVLAVSQAISPDQLGVDGQANVPTATAEATADASSEAGDESKPVARPAAKSVTLAVTPEEAQRLLLASQTVKNEKGSLRLAMRAPGDTTTVDIGPAKLGNVPLGDLLGDVDQAMVPSDVVITDAEFTQRVLPSGSVLEFRATVKNVSDQTIQSGADAPPEYVYTQGVAYDALGFFPNDGTYRIGLNLADAYPNQFPYRWGLGRDLKPGESVDVVGSVQLTEPTPATRYWLGIIHEPNVVTQDGVNVSDITVIPSETGVVRPRNAELRTSPSDSAEVVVELKRGDKLEIVQAQNAWFLVRVGKSEGWIAADAVTVPPLEATGDVSASTSDAT